MNILYYSLPCFLNNGESFKYIASYLNTVLTINNIKNINSIIVKESELTSYSIKNVVDDSTEIKSINFSLKNKSFLVDLVNNTNFNIYHCLHNGFSLCKNFNTKKISTIYTTLPLNPSGCLDEQYSKDYLDRIINTLNISNAIIVPYNFMKNDLCDFFSLPGENIHVIPPIVPFNLIGKSKPLSKAYIKGKFNINYDYYIYVGEINPRNTLIDTIKLFKHYTNNFNVKLILSLTYLNKNKELYYNLISFIDRVNLTSKVIFLNSLSYEDLINLINNSLCFINLNPFNELNMTSLYALFLNTKIITYPTKNNLEHLQAFPIYISNFTDAYNIDCLHNECQNIPISKDELYYIYKKFHINNISDCIYNIYNSIL